MATKHDDDTLVTEATKLLVEIALGNGVLTPEQCIRAQDFITKSCRRNQTRHALPQAA